MSVGTDFPDKIPIIHKVDKQVRLYKIRKFLLA